MTSLAALAQILLGAPAHGQVDLRGTVGTPGPAFLHRSLQFADGVPTVGVSAVAQTADGYLWLGTERGMVRFNGLDFERWPPGDGRDRLTQPVRCLLATPDGALWVGVEGSVLRQQGGGWRRLELPAGLEQQEVRQLLPGLHDDLWILTEGAVVHLEGGEMALWETTRRLGELTLQSLAVGVDGALWVGTRAGPWRLPADGGPPQRWLPVADLSVPALLVERDGTVWLGTSRGVLRASGEAVGRAAVGFGRDLLVRALFRDSRGVLWVGTHGQGVWRLEGDGGLLRLDGVAELDGEVVTSIAEDREGSVWLCTSRGEVHQVRPVPLRVVGRREGVPSDSVSCVLDDRDGGLWVGTFGAGLVRWHGGEVHRVAGPPALDRASVTALSWDAVGRLWVGTERDGLLRLEGGRLEPPHDAGHMVGSMVLTLAADAEEGLWVGSARGLFRLVGGRVDRAWSLGSRNEVRIVLPGPADEAWVGTSGGLFRVEARVSRRVSLGDNPTGEEVSTMLQLAPGELLVGLAAGGACRVGAGGVTRLGSREGLLDDVVVHLSALGDDQVWMLTDRQLVRVSRLDLLQLDGRPRDPIARRALGVDDGLLGGAPVSRGGPGVVELGDGRLAFATAGGLTLLDPVAEAEPAPPRVVIERVVADGVEVPVDGAAELGPGLDRLELQFVALTFRAPRSTRYRYRLDGVDRQWVEAGSGRSTTYAHLTPGDYAFNVAAATASGDWSPVPARFVFRVRPHPWQTRTFAVVVGLLLVAGGLGLHHLRVRRVVRQRQHLQEVVEERMRELAEANDRLEELSVTDPLTGLANFRRFQEALQAEWQRGVRAGEPLALIMVDVDHFKGYNDALGHPAGDRCLQDLAGVLTGFARRPGDLAVRHGGDEFAIVLSGAAIGPAVEVAEWIRQEVWDLALPHPASAVAERVTVSLGVAAAVPRRGSVPSGLGAKADQALFAAKTGGRNRVAVAPPGVVAELTDGEPLDVP